MGVFWVCVCEGEGGAHNNVGEDPGCRLIRSISRLMIILCSFLRKKLHILGVGYIEHISENNTCGWGKLSHVS